MLVQRAENPRGRGGGRPAAARASHRESVPLPADTRIILYREKTRSSMYDIRLMGGLAVGGIWLSGRPDGTFCAFVVCDLPVANRQTELFPLGLADGTAWRAVGGRDKLQH